ncbi:MAG TPA: hypothetical protein PLY12_11470 [Bacillota bacterium]|nr:hypothetical protein [Clostridiaceae bacterium]HNT03555.1 hypothetical protein [Bacillota bacterium]HQO43604.1 hypothetical protein [Bacillota bacterium]HQQ45626.1 hypothetical protein [Bacillota bacterium]
MLEHITLCHKDHEHDNPSYADVSVWINKLLAIEFKGRDILVKQMENSKYELINGEGFISIKFCVNDEKEKFPFRVRVPVEMIAFQQGRHPIMFLLHVLGGIVDELEIYTADGSLIDSKISVLNVNHKVADLLKD